jgi:hypothetical protein
MDNKLHLLQHSLGVGDYGDKPSPRNHFCTGPGSTDFDNCRALVADGLMTEHAGNALSGDDSIFHVTPAGVDYVALHSPARPKVSRGKQRYSRYLEYGDGFESFLNFCRWDADPARSWNVAA